MFEWVREGGREGGRERGNEGWSRMGWGRVGPPVAPRTFFPTVGGGHKLP